MNTKNHLSLTPWGWLLGFLSLIVLLTTFLFNVTGCAGTGKPMSEAESIAWTAANTLFTADAANGQILTKAVIAQVLKATHNDGDASIVLAAAIIGEKVIQAQTQAKAAGVSPTGLQAVTTAILSDPGVIQAAAAAIAPPEVLTTPPTPAPTAMLKVHPASHPRPRDGWLCWDNVY